IVRSFWETEFESYDDRFRKEAISPIQNKIGALLSPPAIRNVIGQGKSTIDVRGIMDGGKVLILNLSKGRLGEAPAHFLGALFATAFAQAAERRAEIPEQDRRDFTLIADEFQNFATESFASVLSEARKWRLSLVLCHQFLGQVPPPLRQAVIGNVGTLVAFRVGSEDAPLIAAELGRANPGELTDTSNFQAWAKVMHGGVPSNAYSVRTFSPPQPTKGCFDAVRARSRARHTRPRAVVEAQIAQFLSGRKSHKGRRAAW
ncbi:MAG TPA: type IV secretory system conjugative DNA transfer family protein, partial [Pseudolabrys sp.]